MSKGHRLNAALSRTPCANLAAVVDARINFFDQPDLLTPLAVLTHFAQAVASGTERCEKSLARASQSVPREWSKSLPPLGKANLAYKSLPLDEEFAPLEHQRCSSLANYIPIKGEELLPWDCQPLFGYFSHF
jgi:hypothetical protein